MDAIADLVAAGRFSDALRAVRAARPKGWEEQVTRDVLQTELLQAVGADAEARALGDSVLRRSPLPPVLAARCRIALGEIDRNEGRVDAAIEQYRRAIDNARSVGDVRQECWAELRMFLAVSAGPGLESATSYLPAVRRNVARLGDSSTTTALHLFVAQVESQRGLFGNATEHIRIARSLMSGRQDLYAEAVAAISRSAIALSMTDLLTSAKESRLAMRSSTASGHAPNIRAAFGNLGHLELARGRFKRAASFLERAARMSPPGGPAQDGIIDGLAQLALARGDLEDAERVLSSACAWSLDAPKGTWYYGLWTSVTRAKLLLAQGRTDEAASLLVRVEVGAGDLSDPLLTAVVRLLLVEARVRQCRLDDAAAVLAGTVTPEWPATVELLAEFGRVVGLALAADAAPGAASGWFERGAHALADVGNRSALSQFVAGYTGAVARVLGVPSSGDPVAVGPVDGLPPPPRRVIRRLDACTPLVPAGDGPAAGAFERAASILSAAEYPSMVGHELMAALQESGAVPAAALTSTRDGQRPEILSWFGVAWDAAAALVSAAPRRIDLGTWQGREYAVVLTRPAAIDRLVTLLALERLVSAARYQHRARLEERERVALWPIERHQAGDDIIACNSQMLAVVETARKVAAMTINVLVTGETGTGKEMIVRLIHAASPRADQPFVPFNCTSVPRDLMDSQLFGHKRGAFTGATADQPGVIRTTAGGTLYLDEIGDLGLDVQPKLLRFLESGEIQPLGENRPQKVDVRIVASTNRNLEHLIADGAFRADLYYRLNVVPLHLPPLRERREEIPLLAEHFLGRSVREFGKDALRLAEETMEYLVLYRWPGNVRQLSNEMRRLAAMTEAGGVIMPEQLDPAITAGRRTVPAGSAPFDAAQVTLRLDQPHAALVEHVERAQIRYALAQSRGRIEDAARLLGLSRKGLYLKRQRLGIE